MTLTATELSLRVLDVAMHAAPTGREQRGFSAIAQDISDPDDRLIALLGALLDGLRHGNWPDAS